MRIHYCRPPARTTVFQQWRVYESANVIVTVKQRTDLDSVLHVANAVILEPGSPVVWFTFPGQWHDIGRFHLQDGTFTGLYANVLTPVRFTSPLNWHTTDLFLDVWLDRSGGFAVLDADELADAVARGFVTQDEARTAQQEVERLQRDWKRGVWPPQIVHEWTLERALSVLD